MSAPADPYSTAPGRRGRRRGDSQLALPVDEADRQDLVWKELAARFAWYDRSATRNRVMYQSAKIAALAIGAGVTVLAAITAPPGLTASLAAAVVILEGTQQVFQFHATWISYRATAESLRQQAFLYSARAGPYADSSSRREQLANLLRAAVATESRLWAATMRQSDNARQS